jgi:hypothetical protein
MLWIRWALVGVIGTLVMDVGGAPFRRWGLTRGAPPQLIGRFFLSVFRGHITAIDPALGEGGKLSIPLLLATHYAIGVSLAMLLGLASHLLGARVPPWWASVLYGTGTTVLPAFWMFPAMGFGLFGSRGPRELLLLRSAIVNHVCFGAGLALGAALIL